MRSKKLFNNLLSRFHLGESSKEIYIRKFQTAINEVSKDDMFIALAHIKINVLDWYSEFDFTDNTYAQRQNSFVSVYQGIENIYQDISQENSTIHHRYFICSVQRVPVGIMTFVPGSSSFFNGSADTIGFMLTHPGSHGCGSLLIEKAVELSKGEEIWAKVKPYALPFYQNLGFEQYGFPDTDTTSMRLIPSESEKWIIIGNHYRLRKYL